MFLKYLHLINFRNFTAASFQFKPVTIFVGKNAQGKSNVLEAIYFLATSKSPKADRDIQIIKQGEQLCKVEGGVNRQELSDKRQETGDGEATKLEINLQLKPGILTEGQTEDWEKRFKVNGVSRRVMDYLGNLAAVYFAPEDIYLVNGPPALRRWYLDLALAQVDRDYKLALTTYVAALASKNRILKKIKEGLSKLPELDYWTDEMIRNGEIITNKRGNFFHIINHLTQMLANSHPVFGQVQFIFQANILTGDKSKQYLAKELAAGNCLIGPHRDDFIFELSGKNLSFFGSRGEQRTAVLELKLAQLGFIKQTKQVAPVLLLDDVFSELDEEHRKLVIEIIGNQQTIMSAVEVGDIPKSFVQNAQVFYVEKGVVTALPN